MGRQRLTQRQIAIACETNRSTVSLWETGKRAPGSEHIAKLATALGTTADYLLGIDAGASTKTVPLDLAAVVHEHDWRWNGRHVPPETQLRARAMLHGLLAPIDQLPEVPAASATAQKDGLEQEANASRTRARVRSTVPRKRPRDEGLEHDAKTSGPAMGQGDRHG